MKQIPQYLARVLRRQPVLAADLLIIHNVCRRVRTEPSTLLAWVVACIVGVAVLIIAAHRYDAWLAPAFAWMATHGVWVAAAVALFAAMQVARRRQAVTEKHAHSWLVAAPRAPLIGAFLLRSLWPLGLQLVVLSIWVFGIGRLHVLAREVLLLTGWIWVGGTLGAQVGWWLGARRRVRLQRRHEDSRYVPKARGAVQHQPSLAALSRLPIARALAWHRPENSKIFVLIVLATIPGGISALGALCVLLLAMSMSYAGSLARAVLQTGSETARWLHATPIRFMAFAWPIMRRAVLHQLVLSVIAAALLLPLGATPGALVYLVVLWLTLVVMTWLLWLRGCFQREQPLLKSVGSVATVLGIEHFVRGWGIACALLWTLWHLRTRPA